ncbi:MAG TPA: ArsA family ATPase [Solirubrobacteraceae bacterium]|nr:ArsA family ATPase [Solirubrobacteraceae bacterium]
MPGLFDRRLIFVTGKGGVGKSTVATALGLVAARRGLRTIVAELAAQEQVRQVFEHEAHTFHEVQLAENLFTISVDPEHAMREYLRVKTGAVGQALGHSRLFHAFAMATPGMRELLSIGKVWELSQHERRSDGGDVYDLVIVDSPAAGHGVGILRTPKTFSEIARVGPIHHQAGTIAATIADADFTAVIAVATAEEMPVNETLWLRDALAEDGLTLEATIVNACYPQRFSARERTALAKARKHATEPLTGAALGAALSEHARMTTQREQLARLREGLASEIVELPYLFAESVGRPELDQLADSLEAGLATLESVPVTG